MMDSTLIKKLQRKQNEFEKERDYYQNKLDTINLQISSLSETINIFEDPKQQVQQTVHFQPNERQRLIIDLLKKHDKPMSTRDLSEKVQELKNIELTTTEERSNFGKLFHQALNTMKKKGLIESVGKDGSAFIWQIKPISM